MNADLYENANRDMIASGSLYKSLVNGIREHLDRMTFISQVVQQIAPKTVLDVGCNLGVIGALVRLNHGPIEKMTGIDWSVTACDFARDHMGYDRVICADVDEWNGDLQGSADLVLCLEILEHVREPRIVVGNCFAWTKRYALFSCPVEENPDGEFHVRSVTMDELVGWVKKANFNVVMNEFLPSKFCEKPNWKGWSFVLGEKKWE